MIVSLIGPRLFRHRAPAALTSLTSLIDLATCCPSKEAHQLLRCRGYNKLVQVALIKDTALLV